MKTRWFYRSGTKMFFFVDYILSILNTYYILSNCIIRNFYGIILLQYYYSSETVSFLKYLHFQKLCIILYYKTIRFFAPNEFKFTYILIQYISTKQSNTVLIWYLRCAKYNKCIFSSSNSWCTCTITTSPCCKHYVSRIMSTLRNIACTSWHLG